MPLLTIVAVVATMPILAEGTLWSQVALIGSLILFATIVSRLIRMKRSSVDERSRLPLEDAHSTSLPPNKDSRHV